MEFPERFSDLPDYAFPRLRALLAPHPGGGEAIDLTIGEPRHPFPDWLGAELAANLATFGKYPPNEGAPALRAAISGWIVVWNDFRGDAWDIYSFDLSTGTEQYVSTSPEDQVHPDVDGRLVTYVCRNGRPAVADARLR